LRDARASFTASAKTLREIGTREHKGNIAFPFLLDGELKNMHVGFASDGFKPKAQGYPAAQDCLFNIAAVDVFEAVFIVEGEQDAACAVDHGFIGVSLLNGGQKKIATEFLEKLSHAESVYFVPDNDTAVGPASIRNLAGVLPEDTKLLDLSKASVTAKDFCALRHALGDSEKFKAEVERLKAIAEVIEPPKNDKPTEESGKLEPLPVEVVTMGEDVLEGRLGEICVGLEKRYGLPRDLVWPSLLTGASIISMAQGTRRNLYTFLHAASRRGKGVSALYSLATLGIIQPSALDDGSFDFGERCHDGGNGSFEGFGKQIGDRQGAPLLWYLDELKLLLKKAAILNASFYPALEKLWSQSRYGMTIKDQEPISFNASLSILGGIQPKAYSELFGPEAEGGTAARILYGWLQDTDRPFKYRPFDSKVECLNPSTVTIDPAVYDELARWQDEEGVESGVAEIALRCAVNAASVDGRLVLTEKDLRPSLALARHQMKTRQYLKPTSGANDGGKVTALVENYLEKHGPDGQWLTVRDVGRRSHAYEYGATLLGNTIRELGRHGGYDVREERTGGRPRLMIRKAA
jgi:hypothetical protein